MTLPDQTNLLSEEELDRQAKEARMILWNQGILTWKLDVTQQKIYDQFKSLNMKTITFNCSRRLGKTYLLTIMAIEQCLQHPDSIVKFLQPKAKMIRGTLRPIMKKILEDCPNELRPVFMTQDNLYRFPNGSEIQLAGTDNGHYESIRGGDCLGTNTLILTPNGQIPVQDIKPGDTIYAYDNGKVVESKVKHKWSNGIKNVTELYHKNQYIGSFTDAHKFIVNSNSSIARKNVIDVEKRFADMNPENNKLVKRLVRIPCGDINEPDAYVIGAFIGDGCSTHPRSNLRFSSQDEIIPKKIAEHLGVKYDSIGSYLWKISSTLEKGKHSIPLTFNYYNEWIKGQSYLTKNFDWQVVDKWNRESCLKLVAGLTDTDGSVYYNEKEGSLEWSYCSTNPELIINLQKLIFKLTQFKPSIKERQKEVGERQYTLRMRSSFYVKELLKELTPYLALQRKKYQPYMDGLTSKDTGDNWTYTKGNSYKTEVFDIEIEHSTHLYLLGSGVVTHNCHLALVDEAGFCDDLKDIIEFILIPTTTLTKGRIILSSTTPTDPAHMFNDIMVDAETKGTLIRKTYEQAIEDSKDTPNARITQNSLDEILSALPGGKNSQAYKTEYNCERVFNSNDSVIGEFAEVEKEAVCEWPRPAFCHKYVSMDIGFSDLTFVVFGFWDFRNAILYIEDEFIINGPKLTSKVLGENIAKKEKDLWGIQPTQSKGKIYKRVADNNSPILLNDLLHGEQKLFFHATDKHNKDAFVNEMKIMMSSGQIKINPRCKHLRIHLKNATWNKTRNDFKRVETEDGHHHYDGVAALMYLVRNIDKSANPFPPGYQYSHLGDRDNVFFREDLEKTNNKSFEKLNNSLFKSNKSSYKSSKK